jgi:hypothetical protein
MSRALVADGHEDVGELAETVGTEGSSHTVGDYVVCLVLWVGVRLQTKRLGGELTGNAVQGFVVHAPP